MLQQIRLLDLQALSRRIHYGKLVAEVKFRESSKDYEPAIRAQVVPSVVKRIILNLLICREKNNRSLVLVVSGQRCSDEIADI